MVSLSYFLAVWKANLGSKILVRKCMRFALCDVCSSIQQQREATNDRTTLANLRRQERAHLILVKMERVAYATRIREATSESDDVLSFALDGADQGLYGLPYFCQVLIYSIFFNIFNRLRILNRLQRRRVLFLRSDSKFTRAVYIYIIFLISPLQICCRGCCTWDWNLLVPALGGFSPRRKRHH